MSISLFCRFNDLDLVQTLIKMEKNRTEYAGILKLDTPGSIFQSKNDIDWANDFVEFSNRVKSFIKKFKNSKRDLEHSIVLLRDFKRLKNENKNLNRITLRERVQYKIKIENSINLIKKELSINSEEYSPAFVHRMELHLANLNLLLDSTNTMIGTINKIYSSFNDMLNNNMELLSDDFSNFASVYKVHNIQQST